MNAWMYLSGGQAVHQKDLVNKFNRLLATVWILLGLTGHLGLGDCMLRSGTGPILHPVTEPRYFSFRGYHVKIEFLSLLSINFTAAPLAFYHTKIRCTKWL